LDQITAPVGRALINEIAARQGAAAAALASDLLRGDRRKRVTTADA
jgi:hypothetical protein